jgi:hypothetical protein
VGCLLARHYFRDDAVGKISMKSVLRVGLLFLLSIVNSIAISQDKWRFVEEEGGSRVYIDTQSYTKIAQIARVSWLSDREPSQLGARRTGRRIVGSILFDSEINCSSRQYRIISRNSYAGRIATGGSYGIENVNGPWLSIENMSLWKIIYKTVCY